VAIAAVVVWGCDYAGFPLAKLYYGGTVSDAAARLWIDAG